MLSETINNKQFNYHQRIAVYDETLPKNDDLPNLKIQEDNTTDKNDENSEGGIQEYDAVPTPHTFIMQVEIKYVVVSAVYHLSQDLRVC